MPDPVAIIGGSGALGHGLGVRFAAAGVPVVIGSRDGKRAAAAAAKVADAAGAGQCEGWVNDEAAAKAPVVFLTVPFASHAETLKGLADVLADGQVLVDATVPLAAATGGKPTRMIGVWQGSAAEQARELLPGAVDVVSALHTVSGETLGEVGTTLDEDVLVCGPKPAKRRVIDVLEQIDGLRGVDCGPLDQARILESLTAMLIGVNIRYKTRAGLRITGLPAAP